MTETADGGAIQNADSSRMGTAVEHLVAATCIIHSRASTSLVDDEGVDAVGGESDDRNRHEHQRRQRRFTDHPAMTRLSSRWISVVVIVAAGCASGAPADSIPADSPAPEVSGAAGTQAPAASGEGGPSQLTFSTDQDRVAEGTVTLTDGGTVAATASDGTTFELVVPPLAVAQDTQIGVTPLSDVRGIGDGAVHAVGLEPEGQVFYDFVRLTITPATPIPLEEQLMFEAAGDGSHPTLALIDPAAEPIVLLLDHFSVAGVASGTSDDRAAVPEPAAKDAEARLEREIKERLQEERAHRDERDNDADRARLAEDLAALLDEYEREVLDPRRRAAHESCAAANALFATLAHLEKWRYHLVGEDAERAAAVMDEARSVLLNSIERCEAEAISKCRAAKPPNPIILVDYWISVARAADLLPAPEALAAIPDSAVWLDRAKEICDPQGFTLEFERSDIPIPDLGGRATDNTVDITGRVIGCPEEDGTWTFGGSVTSQDDYGRPEFAGDLEGLDEPYEEGLLDMTGGQSPASVTLVLSDEPSPQAHRDVYEGIPDNTLSVTDALENPVAVLTLHNGFGDKIGDFELELRSLDPECPLPSNAP